jgi:hypothetical protein
MVNSRTATSVAKEGMQTARHQVERGVSRPCLQVSLGVVHLSREVEVSPDDYVLGLQGEVAKGAADLRQELPLLVHLTPELRRPLASRLLPN